MAEHKHELLLRLNCTDGKLYANQRYLRSQSKLIRSLEKSTKTHCRVLDVPFRKIEVKIFLDFCDQVGNDETHSEYLKHIHYIEFVRMVQWFDLGHFEAHVYDGVFFSGSNYPQFWNKCKKCYQEHFEEIHSHSSSDSDNVEKNEKNEKTEKCIYDYLPEIFKKLGYN